MRNFIHIFGLIILLGCNERYSGENFLSPDQQAELLTDIVTCISPRAKGSTRYSMFDKKFRAYYHAQSKDFTLQYFFISTAGRRYFYVLRPAPGPNGNLRGVGGIFNLDANGLITSFREVFNTPVANREILETRGRELFQWLMEHGDVKPYEGNPDFVEWPNKVSYYDTARFEWVLR